MPMLIEDSNKCEDTASKYLPYQLNYMTDELRKRAKAELFEDEDTRVHSLRLLRTMIKEEKDLRCQDDDAFLLTFLRARKFDVKRAFNVIRNFYTIKEKHHELYHNFDFEDVKRTLAQNTIGFLTLRDEEGCVILIISTEKWNPHLASMGDAMRALTSSLMNAISSPSTQVAGFKVIVDFSGFTLRHVPHVSATYLWLFAEALQNSFPARFREVHIVNEGHLFTYVWAVLKQLLTKKLRERFHFHGKNVKRLHKYFPKYILPAEYDGDQPPFDNSEWFKIVEASADDICYTMSYGYDKNRSSRVKV